MGTRKAKKKKKDPNAPKKAMSSFMLFSNAIRAQVKEENPGLTFGDTAKHIGKRFRELLQEEKTSWEEKASQDKQRFKREEAIYRQKKVAEVANNMKNDDDINGDTEDDSD